MFGKALAAILVFVSLSAVNAADPSDRDEVDVKAFAKWMKALLGNADSLRINVYSDKIDPAVPSGSTVIITDRDTIKRLVEGLEIKSASTDGKVFAFHDFDLDFLFREARTENVRFMYIDFFEWRKYAITLNNQRLHALISQAVRDNKANIEKPKK